MAQTRIWGTLDPFYEHGAVLGRKVANEGVLQALLARDPFDAYHFFLQSPHLAAQQRKTLETLHPDLWSQGKFKILTRQDLARELRENEYAAFHLSDCILNPAPLARLRNALGKNIFPITSVTHSLSYSEYAGRFLRHLWAGTSARDAVVATSDTGRRVVENLYAFLRRGYGLNPEAYPAPRVEVIPLGVDLQAFSPAPDSEDRRAFRKNLGIPEEATAFLVFGRISHSSKMDILPILRAFQRCIQSGTAPESLFLVLAGWLEDEAAGFAATLQNLAANIRLGMKIVPRPGEVAKKALYGASDAFISLSDNPQETFGLTILEAMASGLPVIASDYDGYKDMVEHGRTGFLVETIGPVETDMQDMLAPLCFDNHLHLLLAQETAPDVAETARRIEALAKDPDLRVRLGQAGRERAARFGWETIVEEYLALWERLGQIPIADREGLRGLAHPLETPYAEIFGGYPSRVLDDRLVVTWSRTGQAAVRGRDFPTIYEGLQNTVFAEAVRACVVMARKPVPAGDLAARLAEANSGLGLSGARYHILWCLKHDFLERVREGA